jgi:hypothetical protein
VVGAQKKKGPNMMKDTLGAKIKIPPTS